MKVSESFLVGANQKHAQIIFFIVFQFMKVNCFPRMRVAWKRADPSVTVAGDIGYDGIPCRFFIEAVNRHDRKELADGPDIGERLE